MKGGTCYIGTSGWSYPHWAKGRFYPVGLKPGDWLSYLSQHLPTVEVNSSFYRLPQANLIRRWRDCVPDSFRFAVKLWRRITHDKRLIDCDDELRSFFSVVGELRSRRGPLLVQLPPSFRKDPDRLDGFLGLLRQVMGRRSWLVAVEFRHPGWICPEVYELLSRRAAAVVLADWPRCSVTEPNDAPFVYVRRHGPAGRYRGCYSAEQIAADAASIRRWLGEGRDVFVYYNNDVEGYAVDNARQLLAAVGPG